MDTWSSRALRSAAGFTLALALFGCEAASSVPSESECRALVKTETPDLKRQARTLLATGTSLVAGSDCESGGGYPSVYAGLKEEPSAVVQRMQRLGLAAETRNDECLEHLEPALCDHVWHYTPDGSDESYIVLLPEDSEGEFSISTDTT